MTPLSHWLYFHAALVLLLGLEYLLHLAVPDTRRKAIYATALWVTAALALAAILIKPYGIEGATQYLGGYAIEQALSIDNLFVFLLIFQLFRIPAAKQPRVLFWGVAGAVLLRGLFIAGGVTLLNRFHWVEYVFAAALLAAAIRLLKPTNPETDVNQPPAWIQWVTKLRPVSADLDHFFVRKPGTERKGNTRMRPMMTILFLALIAVELTDIIFALDSIPAVLSITRVPFLAYTSNIMAVMNLRSLYVLLALILAKLRYIHFGLAALLAFAAAKMLFSDWLTITPSASLVVIAVLLTTTIAASLLAKPAVSASQH